MEKTIENGISDIAGVFTDPIIAYPSPWKDDIPQWVKDRIILERLVMNMRALQGESPTGTDAEALAYLMPAALEAPMDHDWTEIYLYISTTVCTTAGKEVPEDIRRETLSDHLMNELNRLKSWIYQRRITARLDRERAEKREAREEETAKRKESQPALLGF